MFQEDRAACCVADRFLWGDACAVMYTKEEKQAAKADKEWRQLVAMDTNYGTEERQVVERRRVPMDTSFAWQLGQSGMGWAPALLPWRWCCRLLPQGWEGRPGLLAMNGAPNLQRAVEGAHAYLITRCCWGTSRHGLGARSLAERARNGTPYLHKLLR